MLHLSNDKCVQIGPPCLWRNSDMVRVGGARAFGYGSWAELWRDYLVFAPVRNPYERAASSYDYIRSLRTKVRILLITWFRACHCCEILYIKMLFVCAVHQLHGCKATLT